MALNLYKIGYFFIIFKDNIIYDKFKQGWDNNPSTKSKPIPLNEREFNTLKQSFPQYFSTKQNTLIHLMAHTRNAMVHANIKTKF